MQFVLYFLICLVATTVGAISGVGGGPINLVVLYYFFSMDTKQAALHSIYVIFFSQAASFVSSLAMQNVPAFDPIALAVMVVGGVAGGFVGRALNKKMSVKQVDTLFTVLLAVITLISVYNVVRYASLL